MPDDFEHIQRVEIAQYAGGKRSIESLAAAEGAVLESKIRYAVLCYGVPLRILKDPTIKEEVEEQLRPELRRNEAAVDSELACLPLLERHPAARARELQGRRDVVGQGAVRDGDHVVRPRQVQGERQFPLDHPRERDAVLHDIPLELRARETDTG